MRQSSAFVLQSKGHGPTISLRDGEAWLPGVCGEGETLGVGAPSETLQSAGTLVYEMASDDGQSDGHSCSSYLQILGGYLLYSSPF